MRGSNTTQAAPSVHDGERHPNFTRAHTRRHCPSKSGYAADVRAARRCGAVTGCLPPQGQPQQTATLHHAPIGTWSSRRGARDAQPDELAEPLERATIDGSNQVVLQPPVSHAQRHSKAGTMCVSTSSLQGAPCPLVAGTGWHSSPPCISSLPPKKSDGLGYARERPQSCLTKTMITTPKPPMMLTGFSVASFVRWMCVAGGREVCQPYGTKGADTKADPGP